MEETILLTGATGFLGSYLLKSFLENDYEVIILKRSISNTFRIDEILSEVQSYDIDKVLLDQVFKDNHITTVIHTACSYGRNKESFTEVVNINLNFGLRLLEASIKHNVKTFVNVGSLLPKDVNYYSLSKFQFSDWLKMNSDKIQIVDVKIEHMYGPMDDENKFVYWLINKMVYENDDINLTSGIQKRDFIYIDDVVSAFNVILKHKSEMSEFNEFDLGTGKFTEVKEFVLLIAKVLEEKYSKEIISRLNLGAINYRDSDVMIPSLDNSSLKKLGWKPKTEINQGIENILK